MKSGTSIAIALLATAQFLAGQAAAHEYKIKNLTIGHPWAPASRENDRQDLLYMTFVNDGKTADRLLKVDTPLAFGISIRTSDFRVVRTVGLEAGTTVEFKPGGLHVKLMGLIRPLQEGEMLPLTLTFPNRGSVAVKAMIMPRDEP